MFFVFSETNLYWGDMTQDAAFDLKKNKCSSEIQTKLRKAWSLYFCKTICVTDLTDILNGNSS